MSFPCETTSTDPQTIFAPVTDQALGMDNGAMKHYRDMSSAGAGKGYWAYFESATGTIVSMNCNTVIAPGYTTQLSAGWNLIGSPYNQSRWNESTVDGISVNSSPKIASSIYGYDSSAGEYYAANIMSKWEGYAVKANSSGALAFNPMTTNSSPIAEAGENKNCIAGYRYWCDKIVVESDGRVCVDVRYSLTCKLDGSGSSDANGDVLTYNWTQTAGPVVEIESSTSSVATFTPKGSDVYTFQLEASDGILSATDTVTITSVPLTGLLVCDFQNLDSTDIYTVDLGSETGVGETRLTDHSGYETIPRWSTDGTMIVFESNRDGDRDVYSMNADGTNQTNLTPGSSGVDSHPDWGANGRIVLRSGNSEIYDMALNGTDMRQLTSIGKDSYTAEYSPDGEKILFKSNYGGDNYELYVINSDGTNLIRLTNDTKIQASATWTSDGRILYTEEDSFITPQSLKVMDADGGNIQTWPKHPDAGDFNSPDMTEDGKFIFYYSRTDRYIHAMLSDGSADASLGLVATRCDHFQNP